MNERAGTHRAGLDGHIHRAAFQTMISEGGTRRAQCADFSVRRWIVVAQVAILSGRYQLIILDNDGADWDFASRLRGERLLDRALHPNFVWRGHAQ